MFKTKASLVLATLTFLVAPAWAIDCNTDCTIQCRACTDIPFVGRVCSPPEPTCFSACTAIKTADCALRNAPVNPVSIVREATVPSLVAGPAQGVILTLITTKFLSNGEVSSAPSPPIEVPTDIPQTGANHSGIADCIVSAAPIKQSDGSSITMVFARFKSKPSSWDQINPGDRWTGTNLQPTSNCGYDEVVPLTQASIIVLSKPDVQSPAYPFFMTGKLVN